MNQSSTPDKCDTPKETARTVAQKLRDGVYGSVMMSDGSIIHAPRVFDPRPLPSAITSVMPGIVTVEQARKEARECLARVSQRCRRTAGPTIRAHAKAQQDRKDVSPHTTVAQWVSG